MAMIERLVGQVIREGRLVLLLPNGHVTEPCWLRGVAGYCRGKFRQHLRLQGGGEAPEGYDPAWL